MMNKKGVSPIIATILLIAIVIILAVIIFLWARGFVSEKAQKFGRAVELSCDDVNFEPGVYHNSDGSYSLDIINRGDIPLYGFVVKKLGAGSVTIANEVFGNTVTVGKSASLALDNVNAGDELLVVPMILGEVNSGKVAYTCPDTTGVGTVV